MIKWLDRGKWTRPSDTMAVYTEIEPDEEWGVRVTLLRDKARVEAIKGEKCSWYKPGPDISAEVGPPGFFERLRRVTFDDKLKAEVEAKRRVAHHKNWENKGKARLFTSEEEPPTSPADSPDSRTNR